MTVSNYLKTVTFAFPGGRGIARDPQGSRIPDMNEWAKSEYSG